MDIYVACQPIFNRNQKVIGYELLYRSGLIYSYGNTDGVEPSQAITGDAFLVPVQCPLEKSTVSNHRWGLLQWNQ